MVDTVLADKELTVGEVSVLNTLMYFDVFNYPLTVNEIAENMAHPLPSGLSVTAFLQNLVAKQMVQTSGGFYYLPGAVNPVSHRADLNKRAAEYLPIAQKMTRRIAAFPFVEAVFITGSLSKNSMSADGDVDYFIIARPQRLWLCRMLMTIYKKVFLLNSRRFFCVNYYIDSNNLAVPDHNIFTATEIMFAIPAYNQPLCNRFFEANQWAQGFYPNKKTAAGFAATPITSKLKNLLELLLKTPLGAMLDEVSFQLFVWRWKKKFAGMDREAFALNLRSGKNVSKHHPRGFQFKVLQAYRERQLAFEQKYGISLV